MADIREQIRNIMFEECEAVESRPKDYSIILDEKGVDESVSRLEQLIKEKQVEELERLLNHDALNRKFTKDENRHRRAGKVRIRAVLKSLISDRIAELEGEE